MNTRNIMGSGKSRIKILPLEDVLMTPEQIEEERIKEAERKAEEERRKEAEKRAGKPSQPKGNIIVPEFNLDGEWNFKWYNGKNTEQMPEILKAGRVPMSSATLFLLRTGKLTDKNKKHNYVTNYFDTADLIAYSTGDELKYVLTTDAQNKPTDLGLKALSWIALGTLVNNGIDLSNGRYEELDGQGIIKVKNSGELGKIATATSLNETLDSKHWRILLRHQDEVPAEFAIPGLHEEAINYIFSEYKNQHAKTTPIDELKLMGVYLASPQNVPHLRAWYVSWLEGRSLADGRDGLDFANGRLVGISARGAGQKN